MKPTRPPAWMTSELIASATRGGGMLALDAQARICFADERAARMLQVPAQALVGTAVLALVDEGWRPVARDRLAGAQRGDGARFELRLQHPDGAPLWVEVLSAAAVGADGRAQGALWILFDVSGRKQLERERDDSEARLRAAFDNFPFDFWVTDRDGRYVLQNAVSMRNWGDRRGSTPREAGLPPAVADEFERNNQRAMRGEVVQEQSEYERHGERRVVEKIIAPVRVGDEIRGTLGVNIDISERKRLEAQLARAERLDAIGRLAGGISHDFNNIITTIMMCAHIVGRRLPPGSPLSHEVDLIKEASARAGSLTRQLLTFARRQPVRPQVVDLDQLLLGVDAILRRILGEDIQLATLPGSAATVRIDPGQLEQVLVNLTINARQAMPRGGTLVIRTSLARPDAPLPGFPDDVPAGDYVLLSVCDSGEGMVEQTLERAFEPFFTGREHLGGTGLGLASSYGIVAQSGGYIQARSSPGHGTAFDIYLPRSSAAAARVERPATDEPVRPGRGELILLVEDEPTVRDAVAQILEEVGYRVIAARGADEAVVRARAERIDLLLSDVVMPLTSGPDLAAQLRAEQPSLPVLFMSGYASDRAFRDQVGRGSAQFLAKPFTPHELARRVREVLDLAHRQR